MVISGIDTKDISIVVQGAISPESQLGLKKLKVLLPNCEIILSTWKDCDTASLEYDILVKSDDPGANSTNFIPKGIIIVNSNRQLVSTQNGLKRATRKYTIKMRTDFYLDSTEFLNYFTMFEERSSDYCYFKHRVIVSSVYSRNFSDYSGYPMPFHPSDFFFFGLTSDIKDYFLGTKLTKYDEDINWKFIYPDRKPYPYMLNRYCAEQYFCFEWAKRHFCEISFEDITDWSLEKLEISNSILFNNFIFLNPNQIKLLNEKHRQNLTNVDNNIYGYISYSVFVREYKKRYDKDFQINTSNTNNFNINIKKLLKVLLAPLRYLVRFLKKLYRVFKRFINWC